MPAIVDLRPVLFAERKEEDVFYKTDTHCNGYGALARWFDYDLVHQAAQNTQIGILY